MLKLALRLSVITTVFIFLVILAGSIVRTTGAGMGCPDWPKCFGYLIPPTDQETLTYREGKVFEKGQMVVLNDTLWVASEAHTASDRFDLTQWHKYERHDYAIFNAVHTWTEYINRLLGALSGLAAFALLLVTFGLRRTHRRAWWFASGAVIMIGVAAWLGKVVVDRNLHEGTITLHMICSMAILAFLVLVYLSLKSPVIDVSAGFRRWSLLAWIALTAQIILGTRVREGVDKLLAAGERTDVMPSLIADTGFIIHRSFSLIIIALLVLMFRQCKDRKFPIAFKWVLGLAATEILAGLTLAYLDLPKFAQPLHLLLALGMFTGLWYLTVGSRKKTMVSPR